ncbi:MAG: DMT family transporter [Prevotella sp.]|nr:DMT family transporter [Prevotella sp.]
MWLILAFLSAASLGVYDALKKKALKGNAVIPVLLLNTLFSSLIFLPFVVLSATTDVLDGTLLHVASGGWAQHKYIVGKALLVLSSWVLGYYGMKHLPLTIVGPINATRPVMVLVGAMLLFGEKLNAWQWAGVLLAVVSFFMLSRSGRKEGIDFRHDHWIYMIVGAAVLGALSGLYDKYLMAPPGEGGLGLDRMMVQSWFTIYQCGMMAIMLLVWWRNERRRESCLSNSATHVPVAFHWDWAIIGISIFLSLADFLYFYALSLPTAMISIVSMVRRGSVVVSFLCGALFFHEKNLKAKAADLALVLLGLVFLYIGSR